MTDQLDRVSHLGRQRSGDVGDLGDAFRINVLRRDQLAIGQCCQDDDLTCGVLTLDIGVGILLGVALLLRVTQNGIKGKSLVLHFGQHIVGGAVENTVDGENTVGVEVVHQRTDDGNAATNARLKKVTNAVLGGELEQLDTEGGNDLLVGGDDVLASLKCSLGKIVGGVCTAHHFGDQSNLGVIENDIKIVHDAIGKGAVGKFAQIKNVFDVDFVADIGFYHRFVRCQDLGSAASNGAESEQCYVDHRDNLRKNLK